MTVSIIRVKYHHSVIHIGNKKQTMKIPFVLRFPSPLCWVCETKHGSYIQQMYASPFPSKADLLLLTLNQTRSQSTAIFFSSLLIVPNRRMRFSLGWCLPTWSRPHVTTSRSCLNSSNEHTHTHIQERSPKFSVKVLGTARCRAHPASVWTCLTRSDSSGFLVTYR